MTPTTEHLEGYMQGLNDAYAVCKSAKRDKDIALRKRITTGTLGLEQMGLRIVPMSPRWAIRLSRLFKGFTLERVGEALTVVVIFGSFICAPFIFKALTGQLMQF